MAQLIDTKVNGDLEVTGGLTLASPLGISSGGTGATSADVAFKNIFGYTPSGIVLYKSGDQSTNTSYNYFHVTYGGTSAWTESYKWGTHLSSIQQSVTWNERTMTNTCIKVADDAPSGCIMVVGAIRYLKETSTTASVQTAIARQRGTTVNNQTWICGTYGNERFSHSFSQLVWVEPGDIIYIGGWKGTASHSVSIIDGVSTRWGAYWVYAS